MEKLESVRYAAALAVTGTWRGTSRERLYNELGWESLCLRRWSRRLILFYKFVNELTPDYTRDPIPSLNETTYPIRSRPVVGQIRARTEKFKASFYPHCLLEWNKLDPEIRTSPTVGIFKKKLYAQIRLPANSVYGIYDPKGVAYLTQLRVGLSKLNSHKFRHNFRDKINPMCPISDGKEDMEHFLLLCDSFKEHRCSLLTDVNVVLQNSGHSVWSNSVLQLLLYDDEILSFEVNRSILTLTITYILKTECLD